LFCWQKHSEIATGFNSKSYYLFSHLFGKLSIRVEQFCSLFFKLSNSLISLPLLSLKLSYTSLYRIVLLFRFISILKSFIMVIMG